MSTTPPAQDVLPVYNPPLPLALAWLPAKIYGLEIARRNRRFDRGIGVTRLPIPVLSVGNLSVGGTGKTPLVRWLIATLAAAGRTPAIAMRGYRAKPGHPSDEADAYARALPDTPIVAQPDRAAGIAALLDSPGGKRVDCIVLDDGFQHRQLARNLDIVVVDASRDPFADRLLPAGWLREPVDALRRAQAFVLTHAEAVEPSALTELRTRLSAFSPRAIAVTSHEWTALDVLDNAADVDRTEPPNWLAGKTVLAVCAIGHPAPFLSQALRFVGAPLAGAMISADHDPYHPPTVGRIMQRAFDLKADVILTTDKDWSKLRHVPAEQWPCAVARPRLNLAFRSGERELAQLALAAAARH